MSLSETAAFIVRGDDDEEYGPVDLADLREWVRENRAGLGTSVRRDEPNAAWQPWQQYPELVALLAEARATGAPPPPVAEALTAAPMARRALAFTLDLVLAYILLIPIVLVTWLVAFPDAFVQYNVAVQLLLLHGQPLQYSPPAAVQGTMQLIFAGGITLYMAGFHYAHGRTPAKSIFRLRVIEANGGTPDAPRALIRGLVLSIFLVLLNLNPFLFIFPMLYAFLNPRRRALHDLVAGTWVVEA